jgi:hypothetical protein
LGGKAVLTGKSQTFFSLFRPGTFGENILDAVIREAKKDFFMEGALLLPPAPQRRYYHRCPALYAPVQHWMLELMGKSQSHSL